MGAPEPPRHLNSRTERAAWRARRRRRRAGLLLVAAAVAVVLAVVAADLPQRGEGQTEAVLTQQAPDVDAEATAGPSSTAGPDRPVNGGFDNGMTGWEATAGAVVSWQAEGHIGGSSLVRANPRSQAAEIAPATSTIDPETPVIGLVARDTAPASGTGTSLQGVVWVRGAPAGATVLVRLTERSGDEEVAETRQEVQLAEDWQEVTVAHAITQEGTTVDLEVLAVDPQPDTALGIDSASVVVAA